MSFLTLLRGLRPCFLFLIRVQLSRRGIAAATLLTAALLVTFEFWRPFPGARTFDPLDIVGSLVGALVGAWVADSVARRGIR